MLSPAIFVALSVSITLTSHHVFGQAPEPVQPAAKPAQQPAKFRYWNTSWNFQEIDLKDLARKLKSIGFALPIELEGTANVNFDIGIPINAISDSKAYRFRGFIGVKNLVSDQAKFNEFSTNIIYADGIATLSDLKGTTPSGQFTGSAKASLNPSGAFEAELALSRINVGPLVDLIRRFKAHQNPQPVTGMIDGEVTVSGDLAKLNDLASWDATGKVDVRDFSIGASSRYTIAIEQFTFRDQQLTIPDSFDQLRGSTRLLHQRQH